MKSTFIKNQFISCLWMFFVCFTCLCQNDKIDSLKSEISSNENNFQSKINLINMFTSLGLKDSVEQHTQSLYNHYKDSDEIEKLHSVLTLKANYHKINGEYDKSIDLANKALNYAIKINKDRQLGNSYNLLSMLYYLSTDSDKCIENSLKALNHYQNIDGKELNIPYNIYVILYSGLIESYMIQGNLEKSYINLVNLKEYIYNKNIKTQQHVILHLESKILEAKKDYNEAINLRKEIIKVLKVGNHSDIKKYGNLTEGYYNLAELYTKINDYKQAQRYVDSMRLYIKHHPNKDFLNKYVNNLKIRHLSEQNELTKLKLDSLKSENYFNKLNNYNSLIEIGKYYKEKKDLKKAYLYFNQARDSLKKEKYNLLQIEILEELVKLNLNKDALSDFKELLTLKEELFNRDIANSVSEIDLRFKTKQKESKIAQQQLQLEKETNRRNLALGSVGLVLFLSFGGFLWFRNKQKNKELQNQNTLLSLQQNLNEMELSNLNKQLDPHEIKNLLASISPEIQDKAPEAYKKMIKLLNITKAGLNSNSLTEAVENQVKQIDDFLSLEKQMSSKEFEYEISNQIKDTSVKIPRLLLKNLVENSIKHGIRKKENGGKIEVQLVEKDNYLYVTVDDTGIGRKFAISQDSGIGTSTYIKLFETLNKRNNKPAAFEILDKEEGTRVEVRIPKEYKYE